MDRRWFVSRTNPEYIKYISKAASVSPAFAQILINRGLKSLNEINDFLSPVLSGLSDPCELEGVKTAVERIQLAVSRNERVLVSGDYDADGLTATAIMVQALRMLGLDVHYFIPNRVEHGYGFNPASVKSAKELRAKLIVTVDCGISSFEAASLAKQEGIDVIITDHHEPVLSNKLSVVSCQSNNQQLTTNNFLIPDAIAVINPKLSNLKPQLSALSGAGIAFKIAQALSALHAARCTPCDLLDLAAIGTIADVVPLTGENRVIVKEGLRLIKEGRCLGIKALGSAAGLNGREIKSWVLSYILIPRINAAGRIADGGKVVRLLLSENEGEASEISAWLDRLNSERQRIEEAVYREALEKLSAEGFDSVIVLSGEGWNQGVVGIVASRLAEEFNRPAFIFSAEKGIAKGSARSIASFDLCKGLSECGELLLSFGGHKQAAGIKLRTENIHDFRNKMSEIVRTSLKADDFVPALEIDANILLSEITHNLIRELNSLEPFGCGNEEPLFGSKELQVINPRVVGNNHLKMRLKQGPLALDAIGFDMGKQNPSEIIDAVFTPNINEWNGEKYLQLNLKAFRPSSKG